MMKLPRTAGASNREANDFPGSSAQKGTDLVGLDPQGSYATRETSFLVIA